MSWTRARLSIRALGDLPGTLVHEVFNDDQRSNPLDQVAGSLLGGVREPVLNLAPGDLIINPRVVSRRTVLPLRQMSRTW